MPCSRGEAGSPSNTKSPGPRPSSIPSDILIHAAVWPQQIWAKNWGAVPLWGEGAGSPSNTMWPGPRPTCTPSFILIHPTVWPQCTNVTDRTDGTGQDRQRSDSIGRTVLQTVAKKLVTAYYCILLSRIKTIMTILLHFIKNSFKIYTQSYFIKYTLYLKHMQNLFHYDVLHLHVLHFQRSRHTHFYTQ